MFYSHSMGARVQRHEPRKQPKQARARATVEAIVEATAHVLVEDGFERLSTNRVAKRAGVSIGSLYQYFPDKQALVLAVAEKHGDTMLSVLRASLASVADMPVEQAVTSYIRLFIEAHMLEPELHHAIHFEARSITGGRIRQSGLAAQQIVETFLAARLDDTQINDPAAAAHVLVCAVESVAHSLLESSEGTGTDALVRETTDMVLRYVGYSGT